MQGLGMNDGDKGGGTAGAQAKLETTKMILLAVLNLLDQPSYSVDRLHRLALLAARKAKETFEYIKKQLLNDDTAKDGLDSIITKLEKKATAKKATEHQSLFVGEENERLLQFEVSAKTVHSTTKQFQILKHTSQMSAVVLTHDLFEHLAAPTLSVVSERQKRVQEGRGLHCDVPQSVACVTLLVDNRVPWAAGHDRRHNIRNLRIVVAAGESDCLHRRRRTRIAIAGDWRMRRKGKMDEDEAAGKQTTSLFLTSPPNDSESPDMVTQTSLESLIKVCDTPSETKPRRMVLELVDERARSDSRMDGYICGAGQRAGVAGVEHRTADHSASSGTDAEHARNMNDMLC
ncbi:hypothetical protein BLNAU_18177 [Blattamonas nauphoetae]|uniref:Uncharacterized protein n=1 Tax=Blattamonas nauphoetae TaxID=2049346 RepID=A0ABQ9X5L1_9EUKA|nr:hypothetical protein BLNAU_18177 [Blattamonas nauphoetae]